MRVGRTRIASPRSLDIRPTSGLVRKVLFDTIGSQIQGAAFLDLFAGTGSVGLEALSRGAASAVFVERHRSAARVLRLNIELAGAARVCRVLVCSAIAFLKRQKDSCVFDIIFADPPYERGYLKLLIHILASGEKLPTRVLIIQTSKHELRDAMIPSGWSVRQKVIGDTVLLLVERE